MNEVMENQVPQEDSSTDDDQLLDFAVQQRKAVHMKLTAKGVPDDPEAVRLIMQNLSGIEGVALGRKRIKSDENTADKIGNATAIAAAFLRERGARTIEIAPADPSYRPPELSPNVPEPELLPGETSQTPMQMSYEEFKTTFAAKGPEPLAGSSAVVDEA